MITLTAAGMGIHDDIIDKSLIKHFRWTILGRFGLDSALLVGDLLILKAWIMVNEMIRNTNQPVKIADIVKTYGDFVLEICEAEKMKFHLEEKWTHIWKATRKCYGKLMWTWKLVQNLELF